MVLFHRSGTSSNSRPPSRDFVSYDALPAQLASSSTSTPPGSSHSFSSHTRPRANTDAPKRLSVFGGRSRNNTITSSVSYQSSNSSMTYVEQLNGRSTPNLGLERPDSVTKSLLTRGSRILRRQNSKFSIASSMTLDEAVEGDRDRRRLDMSELFQRGSRSRNRESVTPAYGLKKYISEPFNFAHVTHTHSRQLPPLHRVTDNELVTEFSAIRASQKPKSELRGIRADEIHFKNFSSEDLPEEDELPESLRSTPSPTRTSSRSGDMPTWYNSPPRLRCSRSIENFSRPALRSPPISPPIAPPRRSSRAALSPPIHGPGTPCIDEVIGSLNQNFDFTVAVPSTPKSSPSLSLPVTLPSTPEAEEEQESVPHAVTTVDDTAKLLRPLPQTMIVADLADVPEEDESGFWQGSPEHSLDFSAARSSLRHSRSFPNARLSYDYQSISRMSAQDAMLQRSETFEPVAIPSSEEGSELEHVPAKNLGPTLSRRFSVGPKTIDCSWEDVVDYSYDHAAESSCNFDWDRQSAEAEPDEGDAFYPQNEDTRSPALTEPQSRFYPGAFRPSLLDTSKLAVPDLEPTSAHSKSTVQEALTPGHPRNSGEPSIVRSSKESGFFKPKARPTLTLGPSLDEPLPRDPMYDELLSSTETDDARFSFYTHGDEITHQSISPRSSASPISKCNSQESMILFSAANVVRKHRSSISTTSLPDLIHSAHNSACREDVIPTPTEQVEVPPLVRKRSMTLATDIPSSTLNKAAAAAADDDASGPTLVKSLHDRSKSVPNVAVQSPTSPPALPSPSTPRTSIQKGRPRVGSRTSSRGNYSLFPVPSPKSPGKESYF